MAMMKVWTQAELYPPIEPAECRAVLDGVLTNETIAGRSTLKRELTTEERVMLTERRHKVVPWLQKSRFHDDIVPIVLEMQSGFENWGETEEEAAVKVKAYRDVLADQPLWAIKRACDRFAHGLVTPDELGEKGTLRRSRGPSTAHLFRITTAISRPFQVEAYRLRAALEGRYKPRGATPEGRKSVEESLARFKRSAGGETAAELAHREEARKATAKLLRDGEERHRREQFIAAGIDPHPTLSLTLLLSKGYSITDHPEGGRVLLKPPTSRRSKKGERLDESSGDEMVL